MPNDGRSEIIQEALSRSKPLTLDELDAIEKSLEPFFLVEKQARWLDARIPAAMRSVALANASTTVDFFNVVPGLVAFRRLHLPVWLNHLVPASDEPSRADAVAIARHSHRFSAELLMRPGHAFTDEAMMTLLWGYAALLKLQGTTQLSCPAEAGCS